MNGCFWSWPQVLFLHLQLCRKSFFLITLLTRKTDQGHVVSSVRGNFSVPEVMKGTNSGAMITDRRSLWVRMMAVSAKKEKCQRTSSLRLRFIRWNIPSSDQYQFYSMLMRYKIYLQQRYGSRISESRNILNFSFQFHEIDFIFKMGFSFFPMVQYQYDWV